MSKIKSYQQFVNESLTVTTDELSILDDIADDVYWKEGDKFAFVDFNGIKNIPVSINNKQNQKDSIELEVSTKN